MLYVNGQLHPESYVDYHYLKLPYILHTKLELLRIQIGLHDQESLVKKIARLIMLSMTYPIVARKEGKNKG